MFRKIILTIATVSALGAAAVVPTAASAHGFFHGPWHGGWSGPRFHHFGGPGVFLGGPAYAAYNPCIRTRLVPTPWGPQLRRVNVCF